MRKTRKHGKKKQVKRKYKSKRLGGGGPREREAAVPYLIRERLNATSLRSHNQTFSEPGIVLQILEDIRRAELETQRIALEERLRPLRLRLLDLTEQRELARLRVTEDRRRSQAHNASEEQAQRPVNALFASSAAHASIYRQLFDLKPTIRELETALGAVVDEEARLNRGRGKRQRKSRKRGKKGGAWSAKYKRSINCNRPRGFSQKQYCKYGK